MTFVTMKNFNRKADYLCFTANAANSSVKLVKSNSPTAVTLETSTDGINWTTYSFGSLITLSNIGDKVYWRNTSETTTGFSKSGSNYYYFDTPSSSKKISASGDINYLLCKNSTTTIISEYCFYELFYNCTWLQTAPKLPATTLTNYCYQEMFYNCTGLTNIPELPAISLPKYCYQSMFRSCSKIRLSQTQTGIFQTAYRIPTTGTGTAGSGSLSRMFNGTGGTFTGTPSINTTYYTSNTLV